MNAERQRRYRAVTGYLATTIVMTALLTVPLANSTSRVVLFVAVLLTSIDAFIAGQRSAER